MKDLIKGLSLYAVVTLFIFSLVAINHNKTRFNDILENNTNHQQELIISNE